MNKLNGKEIQMIDDALGKLANKKGKPIIAYVDINRGGSESVYAVYARYDSGWYNNAFYKSHKAGEERATALKIIGMVLSDLLTFEIVLVNIDEGVLEIE